VLTTSHDYNACRNVLQHAVWERGCKLVVAKMPFPVRSTDQLIETVLKAVTRRTRLAMLDHVTSDTALVYPVAELVQALQARGVDVLVDGAHAPGMLRLNLKALNPAYYVGNLHKWVCAPKGAAFLWVREDHQGALQPAVISHGNNRTRAGHSRFQDRFDWAGTLDPSAWLCVPDALGFMDRLLPGGWPELQRRNHELARNARRLLCEKLNVAGPCPAELLGALATVPLPERFQGVGRSGRIDAEQMRLYDEFGIEVPWNRFGEPDRRWFRISAHIYNNLPEYEYLAEAIAQL
jgi:isopenicillin-N epimerase